MDHSRKKGEGGREGEGGRGRERGKEGGKEGKREGGREGGRERGKEGKRERGKEGEREREGGGTLMSSSPRRMSVVFRGCPPKLLTRTSSVRSQDELGMGNTPLSCLYMNFLGYSDHPRIIPGWTQLTSPLSE